MKEASKEGRKGKGGREEGEQEACNPCTSRELLCRVFIEGSLLLEGLERKSVGLNCVILGGISTNLVDQLGTCRSIKSIL